MTKEKQECGVFKGRSPLFKNLFVWLAVGYILTGLVGSTWCVRDVLTGAGPWILFFYFGINIRNFYYSRNFNGNCVKE